MPWKPKPSACEGCPLYNDGLGFVDSEGSLDSQIILVGEGPGENEARLGRPFFPQAPAGWRLSSWLERARIPRTSVFIDNAIKCYTVARAPDGRIIRNTARRAKKRDPKPKEVYECARRHLVPTMKKILTSSNLDERRRVLIPIGNPAQQVLTGKNGSKYAGSLEPWSPEEFLLRLSLSSSKT